MTTIAWDGATVAADGKVLSDTIVCGLDEIKLLNENGGVFGITGAFHMLVPLAHWHLAGAIPTEMPESDTPFTFIVFGGAFPKSYNNNAVSPDTWPTPWAWGSGHQIAIGALMAGATAQAAVEIACRVDNLSGGVIQTMTLSTFKAIAAE